MMMWDPRYFLFVAPAMLLAFLAQWMVKSAYAKAQRIQSQLSGAAAARYILDSAGLQNVQIEQIAGVLSDHYDPRAKVLRLSSDVYQSRSLAAVGIAAHEAGHAIQDAKGYMPLVIRNAAVPAATAGPQLSMILLVAGFVLHFQPLIIAGIVAFSCIVFFQVVNLPVEFNASARAKQQLVALGVVSSSEMGYVNRVLDAAALTYVAATLQAILTLLYYIMRFSGNNRR